MNGPHDMGGMQCYGPVRPEVDEPVFHAEWEKKALALTVAMGFSGMWNIDISRHARESLDPKFYLSSSYYQIWLAGLQKLLLDRELIGQKEIETGKSVSRPVEVNRVVSADEMPAALAKGGPVDRPARTAPVYKPGDHVQTLNINPAGHTRLPRYARAKTGIIAHVHGFHVFPDSNAAGKGPDPKWLYGVSFSATELFGPEAETGNQVIVDCWEPYLERV